MSAEDSDDDDLWFERATRRTPGARVNLWLGLGVVAVGGLGLALGAFAGTPTADLVREVARARAQRAEGTQALAGSLVLERLAHAEARGLLGPGLEPGAQAGEQEFERDEAAGGEAEEAGGEAKAEPEVEAKAEPKVEPRVEAKVEPKVEAKPVAKPEPRVEAKPEPKAQAKPEPKAQAKPEPKAQAKPEPKVEAKLEPKVEAKPEPKAPELKPAEGAPAAVLEQALNEGKVHLDGRRWSEAKAAYERALGAAPGNTKARFGRGRALFELRQTASAMKDFEAVLAAEPKHPSALLMAGSAAQELGRSDARRFYERYLDAWPTGRRAAEIKLLLERL